MIKLLPCFGLGVLAFLLPAISSQAQVLMLDFGPTAVTGSETNSPYHTTNGSFTDTNWNQVQTADVAAGGLFWSDNTTATGISLNMGATTAATTASSTLLLTATPSGSSALGTSVSTGVYAGSSVGKDGIFTGSGGATRAVGFQLSGLAAGSYEVYVTARNTSTGAQTQTAFVGVSATSGDFALNGAGMSSSTLTFASASTAIASWGENSNYLKFTVSIASGDVFKLAVLGGGGEGRGFLNSVQIVAVPEPSTCALLLGGLGMLYSLRRNRKRA